MVVIDCIAKIINWSTSYIKAIRGVIEALVVIKRIFSKIYLFNRALAANKCNKATSTAPP